jgi:hypothetical protein
MWHWMVYGVSLRDGAHAVFYSTVHFADIRVQIRHHADGLPHLIAHAHARQCLVAVRLVLDVIPALGVLFRRTPVMSLNFSRFASAPTVSVCDLFWQ